MSKVAGKMRANSRLEAENFRGEGGRAVSKVKKKRCLAFTENEYEVRPKIDDATRVVFRSIYRTP